MPPFKIRTRYTSGLTNIVPTGKSLQLTITAQLMSSPRIHEFLQEMHREVLSRCESVKLDRCLRGRS